MNSIWLATANIATAVWVGTIVYQSSVVAATVFKTLNSSQARHFLREIFPRFYSLGLICAIALLVCLTAMAFTSSWSGINILLLATASVMMLAQLVSIWLVPRINAAADNNQQAFRRLHTFSVLLTVLILLLGIGILLFIAGGLNRL